MHTTSRGVVIVVFALLFSALHTFLNVPALLICPFERAEVDKRGVLIIQQYKNMSSRGVCGTPVKDVSVQKGPGQRR